MSMEIETTIGEIHGDPGIKTFLKGGRRILVAVLIGLAVSAMTAMTAMTTATAATAAPGGFKTVGGVTSDDDATLFRIHRHSNATGAEEALTEHKSWSSGWTFVRSFRAGAGTFVFLLKSKDGRAHVRRLLSDGSLGAAVGTYDIHSDVTSAEIAYPGGKPVLILHQRRTGRLVAWSFAANGSLQSVLSDDVHEALEHKDLVKPYTAGGNWYLIGVDRWHGGAVFFKLGNDGTLADGAAPISTGSWTRGWSHVEFFRQNDQTYAILYKSENVVGLGQGGKIGIKRVLNNGLFKDGWHQRPGDGFWSRGYTQIKVLTGPVPDTGIDDLVIAGNRTRNSRAAQSHAPTSVDDFAVAENKNLLLVYKVHSGLTKVLELGSAGIGAKVYQGNTGAGWTDLSPFVAGGNLHLAKVNEEGQVPFDYTMVKKFRDHVISQFGDDKVVGYQLGLMQSGRIVDLYASGSARRSDGIPMTTLSRHGVASVSKMVTAVAILRLIDDGILGWNDRVTDHLTLPEQAPHEDLYYLPEDELLHPSVEDVRISELLTYTARFGSSSSSKALWKPRKADKCEDNILDPTWFPDPSFRCADGYQNSALGTAGFIILDVAGIAPDSVTNTPLFDQYMEDLWMSEALLEGMYCDETGEVAYYKACTGGADCVDGYKEIEKDPPGFCLSGSWRSNAEDLLQLMSVIRYGKVLSPETTDLLLSTTLSDKSGTPGSATVSWNSVKEIADDGYRFSKAGGTSGVKAYVMHLPRGVDAVFMANTSPCNDCGGVGATLEEAYTLAIQE